MTSPSAARRKGLEAENTAAAFFNACGFVCEPIVNGRPVDHGDILLLDDDGDAWILEVKAGKSVGDAVTQGMRELPAEQENAGAPFGAVVVRPRGVTDPARWFVVMDARQFTEVLR